ncbi:MAG TPA: CDP-alcohol phosphatidyltransferase family protein, partial [Geminicoccaceae bacterium]|nr:CDP-alcohol phosphatidyltransferase family protein [Geminicoccaceae bacterium]
MFASRFDQSRARRRRLRARTQPLIALVPNIFTVMSLCAGLTSIRYALDARWELAVGFIILAGILDGLDGRSARLLKLQSNFGAQLDSLADFLSFGVA